MKPQFRTQAGAIGVELFVRIPKVDGYPRTSVTDEVAAGASSGLVYDGRFLAAADYAIFGDAGRNEAEILKVLTISANKKTINFNGTSVFSHAAGSEVRRIPFNRLQIARSTDAGVTFGSPTTVSLDISNPEHYYSFTTAATSDYFRVRFENETTGLVSDWSDSLIGSGYADNTVFAIKKRAVEASGMKMEDVYRPGAAASDEYLNESLYEARRIVHHFKERWSFRHKYGQKFGRVTAGRQYIALPTDLDDRESSKNVFSIHIGDHKPLWFIDKKKWDQYQIGRRTTTLAGAVATTDISINLTDSGDFDESGAISIITDGTEDQIDYTGNDEATNQLSGVTNITAAHALAADVWQNPAFSLPERYTIFGNRVYFDCPIAADYHNLNIWGDYYEGVTAVDSDADVLEEFDYDMYVPYLKVKIRHARNQGAQAQINENDPDYREFKVRLQNAADKDKIDRPLTLIPDSAQ